ncbi:MAG: tryptophan synthase subunit alpha [Solirubrobacterales bacterium]
MPDPETTARHLRRSASGDAGVSGGIAEAFAAARAERRAALMPYMMGGFPDRETSLAVAEAYAEGADLIELGVPFSDPLADGPVIHAAATTALAAGATLETVLETCTAVAGRVPVVLMVYSNMVIGGGGPEAFAAAAAGAGASGVIVPDLPLGEADDVRAALAAAGLDCVPLLAPTTTPERREKICRSASGFLYLVSDVGTTGERGELPADLSRLVEQARDVSPVPVAVGFGIGTPEQAAEVARHADGVIIGSRLVRMVGEAADPKEAAAAVSGFLRETRDAIAG